MANYSYQEAIRGSYLRHLKPQFNLANNPSYEALLIRLLTGTLRVTNIFTTDSFDQFRNYSILGMPLNGTISTKPIRESVEPETSLEKLCDYLNNSRNINNDFYIHLLEELSSYFYKKD